MRGGGGGAVRGRELEVVDRGDNLATSTDKEGDECSSEAGGGGQVSQARWTELFQQQLHMKTILDCHDDL